MFTIKEENILTIKNKLKKSGIKIEYLKEELISQKKVVVICGPTCTGKTRLAVYMVKLFGTDIISVDSMQVYRGMDIGTDKFNTQDFGIRQYMIDIIEPDYHLTAVEFRNICRKIIEHEFFKKNKIPVIAGGSGLYIRAVIDNLEFIPEAGGGKAASQIYKVREHIKENIEKYGLKYVYNMLRDSDLVYSNKISENDERRIIRALEVLNITGIPFSQFQKQWEERKSIYNLSMLGLIMEKKNIEKCIESRVEKMFERGLIQEVEKLIKKGYGNCYSMKQALGYKEVIKYLKGKITVEDCRKEIIQNTKKLLKKQLTWFKADPRINWIRTDNYDNIIHLIIDAIKILNKT